MFLVKLLKFSMYLNLLRRNEMKQAMLFRDPLFFTHVDLNYMNMLNASVSITATSQHISRVYVSFFLLKLTK